MRGIGKSLLLLVLDAIIGTETIETGVDEGYNILVAAVFGYILNHENNAAGAVEVVLGVVVELEEEVHGLEHLVDETSGKV